MLERTLVLLKPDTVSRALCGEIITRFERVGLKIVAMDMRRPDQDFFFKHYEEIGTMITRHSQEIFDITVEMMMVGPVIAMVLEGSDAVEVVRKLVGPTESKSAPAGTIRGDYSHMSFSHADAKGSGLSNLVHASGDSEEAVKEVALWFADEDFHDHQRSDADFVV